MPLSKQTRIWVDIIMIAFVMLFPHYAHLPMYAYPFVVLGVIWIYLNFNKESFASIGFRFADLKWRAFYVGGVIGLVYAAFHFWILGPFITHLGFKSANLSDFNFIRHHFINYIFLLLLAAFLVVPYEEIVFRGFIFNRVRVMFGKSFLISAIITSILFALYHWQEGWGAVIAIFIFALFITWLYKVFKGNLWYLIFFHLLYDTFMLTMILLGKM
ncbi:CPBP family intramembrane glutamic endopeptidase [Mucilaginibacter sp. McL0603]|uniref:CPBP family intramembrane glutamic endopeptidase n=1 Tax=Mucilaginibacter sp. McL0603 TaxID=3415670 RepID=UPI003CE931FB